MVRVGTLPMRMLCLQYGASLVYTEELIDRRLVLSTPVENALFGTTDFVDDKGVVIFRTTTMERERVVLQIGTASPELALQAASVVAPYVAGAFLQGSCVVCRRLRLPQHRRSPTPAVDVNMGCPVHFRHVAKTSGARLPRAHYASRSTSGGMGSALLKQPERAAAILKALVNNLPCPVTCKIRLLPTEAETVAFAQMAERCGVCAVAVHGRYVAQRPREPAHWAQIATVVQALRVPVVANGDVFVHADFERARVATGAAAVMAARGAQWNASIFREEGSLPPATVRREYAAACVRWGNPLGNSKYCLREMLIHDIGLETVEGRALAAAKTDAALAELYGTCSVAAAPGKRSAQESNGEQSPPRQRRIVTG